MFWEACEEVLPPNSAAEERYHHDDTIYILGAHSIPNLINLASEILHWKLDSGELDEMPPIMIKDWVCLQLVTNAAERKTAGKFTGRLNMKQAVQTRTLRKDHVDQHWVNAMTIYYLE